MSINLAKDKAGLSRSLGGLAIRLLDGNNSANRTSALRLEAAIKAQLNKKGTGIIRTSRGSKNRKHQSAAPGEPPARDISELIRSIGTDTFASPVLGEALRVGTGIKYAEALEFGTLNRRILPRPFMRPARALVERTLGPVTAFSLRKHSKRVAGKRGRR